ncbi:MAG: serine hydrolase [Pseudomonadota bacterium]
MPPSAPPSGPLPAPPTPAAWVPVQTAFDRAYAATRYGGAALAVYAPDGRLLYSRVRGDFAPNRRVAVASASKLVSGVALLRLVDQGLLSLDSTTGAVLGWTGPQAVTGFTPTVAVGLEYGLTAWLECATPAAGCDVLSSAGAFGFMPWIDRAGGYYAIIGMEEVGDPTEFSTRLAVELRPLIRTAIRG